MYKKTNATVFNQVLTADRDIIKRLPIPKAASQFSFDMSCALRFIIFTFHKQIKIANLLFLSQIAS